MATKKVVADHDFLIPEFKLTQVADINYEKLPIIRRSSDAVEVLSKYIAQKDLLTQISVNEFAFVLYLNKQNRVIGITNLSIGGLDSTLMDVRMVYSMAVKIGASSIIVAHNHPSQNLKPSEADIRMSNLMRDRGKSLTIQVLDFFIITSSSGYYSFGDEGMMERGGIMAKGGITEHGLRVGDTIVSEIDENTIVVENPTSGRRTINISTGHPMAKGGEIVDDEGNVMNLKVGDKVVNYRQTNPNQPKQELGGEGEIVAINGVMGKVFFESTNYEKWYPLKDLKKTSHNKMAKGGRMGFKALSEKVASHYAGKSVPTKYQPEYGKFYDADEAKTVGNKVAAKVYRLQQGK